MIRSRRGLQCTDRGHGMSSVEQPSPDECEQRRLELLHLIEIERTAARKKPGSDGLQVDVLAAAAALIHRKD